MKLSIVIGAALVGCVVPVATSSAHTNSPTATGGEATYEGGTINLSRGWGAAKACMITDDGTACFATEEQLDSALADDARITSLAATATDHGPGAAAG